MKVKVPHTLVIIFLLTAVMALLTHIVPAGSYETVEKFGKHVVVAGSYKPVDANPQGILDVLQAPMKGMKAAASIIFFVLIVGGAFGVLNKTQVVEAALGGMIKKLQGGKISVLIGVVFVAFALACL